MSNTVDALKEISSLVDKTTAEIQYIFDAMPGVIEEKCTGMWKNLPRGSSKNPSRNSSSTDVTASAKEESSGVNMSASTGSTVSTTGNTRMDTKIYHAVDKKEVLITTWVESAEPIDDEEMREIEKVLLG